MNLKKKIIGLGLLIICLFSFIYIQPILASTWEDYSVEQGDDLFESYPYDFSVLYYDENNYSKQFTQAKLETQHAIYSDISTNNSITDLTNYYNYYPEDLTINQGINNSAGTLNNLDNDYYNISSTPINYSIPSESNFSVINGTLNSFGDLQYSDDEFVNFTCTNYKYPNLIEKYNATYHFEDDTIDSDPDGWSVTEPSGCDVYVYLDSNSSINQAVKIKDRSSSYETSMQKSGFTQQYGTIEFYMKASGTSFYAVGCNSGTTKIFNILMDSGIFYYYDGGWHSLAVSYEYNQWYHIRFDFEFTTGEYMGLSQYTYDVYINNIFISNVNFFTTSFSYFNTMRAWTGVSSQLDGSIDCIDFSWTEGYYINRNQDIITAELNFTSSISLTNFTSLENLNLIYALNNTQYQTINFSIYNFTSSSYYLIESKEFTDSDLNNYTYFPLNNDFFNDSYNILVRFNALNITTVFELDLNRLAIVNTSFLNINCIVDVEDLINLLELQVSAYYYTSISQTINFSIYCFDNSSWVLINSSINYSDFYESLFIYNSSNILNFFNTTQIKLQYYAVNQSGYQFNSYIDFIQAKIFTKLELSYSLSFNIKGLYRYRFHIYGTEWNSTSWIYFEVIEKQDNIELISESDYMTKWDFSGIGTNSTNIYLEDFDSGNRTWDLYDSSKIFYTSNYENYLYENMSTGLSYTGISHKIQGNYPMSIRYYNSYFYVAESGSDKVYKYTTDWSYTGDSYYVGSEDTYPTSIYNYNGSWYMLGFNTAYVYEYYQNWSYTGTSYYVGSQDPWGFSISFQDGYWWKLASYTEKVYKYYQNWSYTGDSYYIGSEDTNMRSIQFFEGNWWAVGVDYDRLYKYYSNWSYTGTSYNLGSQTHDPHSLCYYDQALYIGGNDNHKVYEYYYIQLSKINQNNTNSYLYIQTDTIETLRLRSNNNTLSLNRNDRIEVIFNTTNINKISLNLLNSGNIVNSYTLSTQGNNKFYDRTLVFSVDTNFTITQIEFSGIFEDTKNLILKSVRIYRFNEEIYSFYMNPDGIKTIFLDFPVNYSYNVYENNELKKEGYILTSQSQQVIIYERTDQVIVYINYYDSNNEFLNFQNFISYCNYTIENIEYTDKRLSSHILYVDKGTSIYFDIYDSFNSLIKTDTRNSQTFIDITLPVYILKIKNEASKNISYTLTNNATSESKTGKMFSQELIEFNIATGIYILNYTNSENNQDYSETITLNDNLLFTIQSTYFQVYFALFNYDGLGLDNDLFRFYINNERKDLGFNTLTQDTNRLVVRDYFNATLKDTTVNLRQYTEYNLAVSVYTLVLNNKYNRTVKLEIERTGTNIVFEATIRERDSVPYRFLANIEYEISIYEIDNNTLLYHEERLLDDQFEIVDFGFYEQEFPAYPVFNQSNLAISIIIILTIGSSIISIIIYIAYKYRERANNLKEKERRKIDFEVKKYSSFLDKY